MSLSLLIGATALGADYQGAGFVLRKIEEQSAKKPAAETTNETSQLQKALADFSKTVALLPAAGAAKGWLELVDRYSRISQHPGRNPDPFAMQLTSTELMAALPPPAAWSELSKAIAARPAVKGNAEIREIGLKLLAATLTGDGAARTRDIGILQEKAGNGNPQSVYFYRSVLEQISEAMLATLDDPDAVLKSLERRLTPANNRGMQQLRIPNLVSLVGTQKAEVFLRRALQQDLVIDIEGENETSRLAQKLALELIDGLKKPQWSLVSSLDAIELYEAMDKRFGQPKEKPLAAPVPGLPDLPDLSSLYESEHDYGKLQAQSYYLLGLISKERTKEAVTVAKKLGKQSQAYMLQSGLKALERAGYARALDDFFYELLSQDPTLSYWDEYVQLAAKAGQTDRMLKLARATAARQDLPRAKTTALHQTLYRAFLASGQTEEGVQEMRRLIELGDKNSRSNGAETAGQLGLALARIGVLSKRPEWTDEGIRVALKSMAESEDGDASSWQGESLATSLAIILLELQRGPEAEGVLTDALSRNVKSSSSRQDYNWNQGGPSQQTLAALASLYHGANRRADVITLLDQAPYWGAKDLAEIHDNPWGMQMGRSHHSGSGVSLRYVAASAMAGVGRKAEAHTINNAILDGEPGSDRGYELLIELGGDSILARLDELFARDPFEERPLIWKAELLRRANNLEEAEKTVRQAISIDPSDGEQGPGDRLRAYAVLADIREARGDKKEAEIFRGAVRAIRLAENADRYYEAGLLKLAIQMYEDSLKQFADAYCIQSRLAVQLAELGRHEEAEAHYRRAYELMPDSFGRVESHCFGCERAFEGQRAQSMAEKIFTELAVKTPDKPQVHYLLGYLRKEQERHAEALPHFQTAVKLDPDYLNAWKELDSLADHIRLPAKERDRIAFNMLRLDPLQRHARVSLGKVSDLAGLWNAIEAGQKRRPPVVSTLYPLPASRAALEESGKAANESMRRQRMYSSYRSMSGESDEMTPARAISETPFVRVAAELFAGNNGSLAEE